MSTDASDSVAFHLYLDPSQDGLGDGPERQLARCREARDAWAAQLLPWLASHVWEREPLQLWVWDPADSRTHGRGRRGGGGDKDSPAEEAHVWGRLSVGGSVHDEWVVVAALLRLTGSEEGVSATLRDGDGELLLIEAAYSLPDWLTPENAPDRALPAGRCR